MAENDIPFPLLSGQFISSIGANGQREFYQIIRQPTMFDLTYQYAIAPTESLEDQTITNGTGSGQISVFKTNVPGLKQWVTWIDNDYLGVSWNVVDVKANTMLGFNRPLTKYTSPFGSVNFPLFILNNSSGNVTFNLTNLSKLNSIAGTLHVLMYEYVIKPYTGTPPTYYTDISYKGSGSL